MVNKQASMSIMNGFVRMISSHGGHLPKIIKDYDLLELFCSYYILETGEKNQKDLESRETLETFLPIYLTDKGKRATI